MSFSQLHSMEHRYVIPQLRGMEYKYVIPQPQEQLHTIEYR